MSASVGVYVATALFLAIGGDSEEPMGSSMRMIPEVECELLQAVTSDPCDPLKVLLQRWQRLLRDDELEVVPDDAG